MGSGQVLSDLERARLKTKLKAGAERFAVKVGLDLGVLVRAQNGRVIALTAYEQIVAAL